MKLTTQLRNTLDRKRRKLFEAFGDFRYSRPSEKNKNLDKKLEKYLDYEKGFFVEAGAYNGYNNSNTYYLEACKKWSGILIEPVPELYKECLLNRPKSKVFNCALVSPEFTNDFISIEYFRARSFVKGSLVEDNPEQRKQRERDKERIKPYNITVAARTMQSVLEECNVVNIDFFSLDVEGYELNVLKGLNLRKYLPKYLLIEILEIEGSEECKNYIEEFYEELEQLSSSDFLYRAK